MKEQKKLIKCCAAKMHGGQSGFSRAADYIAVRAMAFIGCYLWFGTSITNRPARTLLSLSAGAFIAISMDLIHSLRLDGFIKKTRKKAEEKEFNRRLSMLTDNERRSLIKNYGMSSPGFFSPNRLICTVNRSSGVSAEDVLNAARGSIERKKSSAAIFHSGPVLPEAEAAMASYPEVKIDFISYDKILGKDDLRRLKPSREETDKIIIAEEEIKKQSRKAAAAPFAQGRTKRYIWAAACLIALSFGVENPLYYRLMASVCIFFGATAWWLNKASA